MLLELNATTETFLICISVFLLIMLYSWFSRAGPIDSPRCPSGPSGWRIVHILPGLITEGLLKGRYFHELLIHWGKKFGGFYYISLGPLPLRIAVINDFGVLREAWKHQDMNDRAPSDIREAFFSGKGIIFSSGALWKEQRKFSLSVLRSFGVGKRSFESEIADESKYLTNKIHSYNGMPFDPTLLFCNAVANVICSVTFGKRCDHDDNTFQRMMENVEYLLEREISIAVMTQGFPFSIHMPFGPVKRFRDRLLEYRESIRVIIKEHRDTFDSTNLRDFIDVYLHEMQLKKEQGLDTKLSEDNLEAVLEDLFFAGSETTATTLRWCALLMMEHPDVQSRVHRELDDIIGRNRLPILADKDKLPYTEAVIQEIQRYATIAPIGAPHFTTVETTFRGYRIPKETMIIGNLWSISRDRELWNDDTLHEFRPERFLDENCNTVKKPEYHIVFGSGKRACIGEQLGKMEVFIFLTHMLHQFTMKRPSGQGVHTLRGKGGAVHSPYPYKICLEPREMTTD